MRGIVVGRGGKGRARTYSANDMRSMAKNPTSSHYRAAQDNRANQLNPRHPAFESSREDSDGSAGGAGEGRRPLMWQDGELVDLTAVGLEPRPGVMVARVEDMSDQERAQFHAALQRLEDRKEQDSAPGRPDRTKAVL